jgi:TusE/DsrC/DsvC family sulfur relay protein
MQKKTYKGVILDLTDDGNLIDSSLWSKEIAVEIAKEENIILTDLHFAIIGFLRNRFIQDETLSIRSINSSGIMDVKTFYQLFPGAPLKKACKIAGLPKPVNCI